MKNYFDSAALVKAYCLETTSRQALSLIRRATLPLPFTPLHALEIRNALRLKRDRKELTESQLRGALRSLQDDIDSGFLGAQDQDLHEVFVQAESLSAEHTVSTGVRSLDIYGADVKERKQEITDKTAQLIRSLVNETGAQGVIPLGGALIPSVVDPADLQAITGVPVYNTKAISVRVAEMCVSLGLTQSPLTYPRGKLNYQDFAGKLA